MEEREVTVVKERTIPAIQHTAHTEWRAVERQRLQPIAARREGATMSGEEEKEQITVLPASTSEVQQADCATEQDGELIAELGVRVAVVFGRHSSNSGLLVCGVTERDAGSRAGVLAGDVIMSVNGSEVRSVEQLRSRMASTGPLSLRVMRHGRRHLTLVATVQR